MSHGVQVAFVGYAKSFVIKSQPPFFHPFSLPTTYAYSWGNDYSDQLTLYPIDIALAHNIPRMFFYHWLRLSRIELYCDLQAFAHADQHVDTVGVIILAPTGR